MKKQKIIWIVMLVMIFTMTTSVTAEWKQLQYDNFSSGFAELGGESFDNLTLIKIPYNATGQILSADLDKNGIGELYIMRRTEYSSFRIYNASGDMLAEENITAFTTGNPIIADLDDDGWDEIMIPMGQGTNNGYLAMYNYTNGVITKEREYNWNTVNNPYPTDLRAGTWDGEQRILTIDYDGDVRIFGTNGATFDMELVSLGTEGRAGRPYYPILLNFDKDATNDLCWIGGGLNDNWMYCIDENNDLWVNTSLNNYYWNVQYGGWTDSDEAITGFSAGDVNGGNYDFIISGEWGSTASLTWYQYAVLGVFETTMTSTTGRIRDHNQSLCNGGTGGSPISVCVNAFTRNPVILNLDGDQYADYCTYSTYGRWVQYGADEYGKQIFDCYYGGSGDNAWHVENDTSALNYDSQFFWNQGNMVGFDMLNDYKYDFTYMKPVINANAMTEDKFFVSMNESFNHKIDLYDDIKNNHGTWLQESHPSIHDLDYDGYAEITNYDRGQVYLFVEDALGTGYVNATMNTTEENETETNITQEYNILRFNLVDYDTEESFDRSYNAYVYEEGNTANNDSRFSTDSIYYANLSLEVGKTYVYRFETFLDTEDYYDYEGYFSWDNITNNFTIKMHEKVVGTQVFASVNFYNSPSTDIYGSYCIKTNGTMTSKNVLSQISGITYFKISNQTANYTFDCFETTSELQSFRISMKQNNNENGSVTETRIRLLGENGEISLLRINGTNLIQHMEIYNGTGWEEMGVSFGQEVLTINLRMNVTSGKMYDVRIKTSDSISYETYSTDFDFLNGADNITRIEIIPLGMTDDEDSVYIESIYLGSDQDSSTLSTYSVIDVKTISGGIIGSVDYYIEDDTNPLITFEGTSDSVGIIQLYDLEEGNDYYIQLTKGGYLMYRDVFSKITTDTYYTYYANMTKYQTSTNGNYERIYEETFEAGDKIEYRGLEPVPTGTDTILYTYGNTERWLNFSSGTNGYVLLRNSQDEDNWETLQDAKVIRFGFTTILKGTETSQDDTNAFFVYLSDTFGFSSYLYMETEGNGVVGDEEIGVLYSYNPYTIELNEITTFNPREPLGIIIQLNLDVPSEQTYDVLVSKDGAGYSKLLEGEPFIDENSVSIREVSFIRAFNDHKFMLLDDIYVEKSLLSEGESFTATGYGNQTIRGINGQDLCSVWYYDSSADTWKFDANRCYACGEGEPLLWCAGRKMIRNLLANITLWFMKNLLYVIIFVTLFVIFMPVIVAWRKK